MFSVSYQAGMASQNAHILQIRFHIVTFTKQLIPEQAVYRKNCRALRKITADSGDSLPDDSLVIRQFQKNQNVGIIYLAEAGKGIVLHFFNGYNTGIVAVNFSERILESLRQDPLIRHMKNVFIDLLGRFTVKGTDYVIGSVCIGSDKTIVSHLAVDIFLISFNASFQIPHQRVGHGVLINLTVGGYFAAVAGTAYQLDASVFQRRINGSQNAGVVTGTKIDTYRIVF